MMRLETTTDIVRRPARPRGAGPILALAVTAALLAGCGGAADRYTEGPPTDGYRTKYPIVVAEGEETMDIPVGMGFAGLSETTRANVRAFAADASSRGTSSLVILAPSGSGNQRAAAAAAREARAEAISAGMTANLVEVRHYAVGDSRSAAPIRLSYNRIKAMSPPCGLWEEQMLPGRDNGDTAEFGCTTQANLAAMIANPEDLITPRASTPPSAVRRENVHIAWRENGSVWSDGAGGGGGDAGGTTGGE